MYAKWSDTVAILDIPNKEGYRFIPASNEPSDCLQTFGDCCEGQIPTHFSVFSLLRYKLAAGSLTMATQMMAKNSPDMAVQYADRKENPLAKVEELIEGNYNQIDGIIDIKSNYVYNNSNR